MALVLAWQFATALAHLLLGDTPVEEILLSTHKVAGLLLNILVVIRVLWSLYKRGHRPPSLNAMAQIGHLAMYALMVFVPLIALLRQYGSGDGFAPFGVPLMPGFTGDEIEWLQCPAICYIVGWAGCCSC